MTAWETSEGDDDGFLFRNVRQQLDQGSNPMAGWPLRHKGLLLIRPSGFRAIQMHPGCVTGKLAHEHRSRDGATVPSPRVSKVRDRTLVEVAVIFVHRKRPHFLPRH